MLNSIRSADTTGTANAKIFLKHYAREWKKETATIFLIRFLAELTSVIQLILIAGLLADFAIIPIGHRHTLDGVIYFSLAGLSKMLLNYCSDIATVKLDAKITIDIRNQLVGDILTNGFSSIHKGLSGGLSLSFMKKAAVIAPYFSKYRPQVFLCMVMPLVVTAYFFSINWVYALIVLFCIPIIPIFMVLIGKGAEEKSREQWYNLSAMGGYFLDHLRGLNTLYLFGQLKDQEKKVGQTSEHYSQSAFAVLKIAFLSGAVIDFFSAVIIACVAVYIGLSMVHYIDFGTASSFTLKQGLTILLIAPESMMSLKKLGSFYHERTRAIGAIMDLQQTGLLDGKSDVTKKPDLKHNDSTHPKNKNLKPPSVIFKNIEFTYEDGPIVFKNFSHIIRPYEKIHISGSNGSGKSTLLSLVMGWQKPSCGTIHLEYERSHDDIPQISTLSWIGQQNPIFEDTIKANILMGTVLDDEELYTVIKMVSLENFIQKATHGLNTVISEDAKSISGGERQKIALARALAKKSTIILMDEPLSNLDHATAANFIEVINTISKYKTIIITGHGESYQALPGFRKIKIEKNA